MKKAVQIFLLIISVILANIGFFTAIFGSGSVAVPIVEIAIAVVLLFVSAFAIKKPRAFGNMWRFSCLILAVIFVLSGTFSVRMGFASYGVEIADYATRVEIWGDDIAGNSDLSKLDDMNIKYNARILGSTTKYSSVIRLGDYADTEKTIDTFTYLYSIKNGTEKQIYQDAPYLIPYTVENATSAVIVICGGGFGFKNIAGDTSEGKDVALALNKKGISAFVLWYRSNPYQFPVPQLDVQRAVRYVRFHAEDFGINPEKISLLGFGTGGYLVGSFINCYMGKDFFATVTSTAAIADSDATSGGASYIKDEVDAVDDSVAFATMIYPMTTFKYNASLLFAVADAEAVRDETKRAELLTQTDLAENFNSAKVKQLVCYGTADQTVGADGAKEYIEKATEAGCNITELVAEEQDYGFGTEFWLDNFVEATK